MSGSDILMKDKLHQFLLALMLQHSPCHFPSALTAQRDLVSPTFVPINHISFFIFQVERF